MYFLRNLFFLVFFCLEFIPGLSFAGVEQVAFWDTGSNSMNIIFANLVNSGQTVYITLKDSNGLYRIKSYNINKKQFIEDKVFAEPSSQKVRPSQIIVNASGNLLALEAKSQKFAVFNSSGKFIRLAETTETIISYVYSPICNCMFCIVQNGKVKWTQFDGFQSIKSESMKILQDRVGENAKIRLSKDEELVAVTGSKNGYVYIYSTQSKTLKHTFNLNRSQIKFMSWNSDGNRLYVTSLTSGVFYELVLTSPSQIQKYRYESEGIVNVNYLEYNQNSNEVLIFSYKQSLNKKVLYSFSLGDKKVTNVKNLRYQTIYGSSWDKDDGKYFLDWNGKQIWVRKVIDSCSQSSYFDECQSRCLQCTPTCENCSAAGCGGCSYKKYQSNANYQPTDKKNYQQHNNTTNSSTNVSDIFPTQNNTINEKLNNTASANETFLSNETMTNNSTNSLENSSDFQTPNNTIEEDQLISSTDQSEDYIKLVSSVNSLGKVLKNDAVTAANKMPGGRKFLKPILTFFNNLDDFWLYTYHHRNYDMVMNSVFSLIRQIENQKWELIPYEKIWQFFGFDVQVFNDFFAYKQSYTESKFLRVENNPNGFYINTANFFQSNMIFTAFIFVSCRLLFFLLFKHKISVFFRKFSFWGYLFIILLEGNLQYTSYLVAFDLKWLFSDNFVHKMMAITLVSLFYFVFTFAIGCYFFFKYMYRELSKYFFENSKSSNSSAFYLATYCGLRNILLGFTHLIDFENYTFKISILFAIQFAFLLAIAQIISSKKIFEFNCIVWVTEIGTFIRLMVIGVFYFEQDTIQNEFTSTSQIFLTLIVSYFGVGFCGCVIELIKIIFEIVNISKKNSNQEIQVVLKSTTTVEKSKRKLKLRTMKNKGTKVTILPPQQSSFYLITEEPNESIEKNGESLFEELMPENSNKGRKLKTIKLNKKRGKLLTTIVDNQNLFENQRRSVEMQDFDYCDEIKETENLQSLEPMITAFKSNVF